ncbi:receptor-like protein EIX2 [Neltuma alba]|uniref:receptor-like protein EIX2 n=1 Tax=Neltuma alba TaxID=207710 RepID=UPI0010A50853|nr:receptor-like protein EIX2 [Prosopis alba]
MMNLTYLNLSQAGFGGRIPHQITNLSNLLYLDIGGNHFMGSIPQEIGNLSNLIYLDLRGSYQSDVDGFYVGNLQWLGGTIASWVGQHLPNVKILVLKSNKFSGQVPFQICYMRLLQVLDLAQNKLTGQIPKCINHLSAISIVNSSSESYILCNGANNTRHLVLEELLSLKGRVDYRAILGLITSIDLSSNKLSGEIPMEITRLKGLHFLNVSNNCLSGQIPKTFGNLESLESVDFSRNHLVGEIPQSITKLSFLSFLNLSRNDLEGRIPTGTELQSFEASSFAGNNLCGPPLTNNCTSSDPDQDDKNGDHGEGIDWFFVSMTLGFVVGFWVVVGPLLYKRLWRYVYFQFLDGICKTDKAPICIEEGRKLGVAVST